jgi:hypothetical protein
LKREVIICNELEPSPFSSTPYCSCAFEQRGERYHKTSP